MILSKSAVKLWRHDPVGVGRKFYDKHPCMFKLAYKASFFIVGGSTTRRNSCDRLPFIVKGLRREIAGGGTTSKNQKNIQQRRVSHNSLQLGRDGTRAKRKFREEVELFFFFIINSRVGNVFFFFFFSK